MVTGQRAFQGDSPLSTLTAVLREEPKPISRMKGGLPLELERVITRCLRKDPERRWQSMADVKLALRELKEESDSGGLTLSAPAVPRPRRSWVVAAALAVAVAAGVIGALVWRNRDVRPESRAVSFTAIPLTTYQGREQQPAFSPDGNSVAFIWNGETEENWDIYVKLIGPGSPQRLTSFAVARDGIYFESSPPSSPLGHIAMLPPFTRPQVTIDFLSFATGRVTRVMTMARHAALGLDVSPDGRTLLFAQSDSFTEDLMLVENFR